MIFDNKKTGKIPNILADKFHPVIVGRMAI